MIYLLLFLFSHHFPLIPPKIVSGYILKGSIRVYSNPYFTRESAGIIKGNGYWGIKKVGKKCKYGKWYLLDTGHWVCSGWFIPSDRPKGGASHWSDEFQIKTYYRGLDRHSYFAEKLSKLSKGIFRRLRKLRGFLPIEQKLIANFPYFKTYEKGYIPTNKVIAYPSTYLTGLTVTIKQLPFAIVKNPSGAFLWRKKYFYYNKIEKTNQKAKKRCLKIDYDTNNKCWEKTNQKISKYSFRAVKCQQNSSFCLIRNRAKKKYYIKKSDISVAYKPPAPPAQIKPTDHWVDVDLTNNIVYALKGKKLIKIFLSSASEETPVGIFKIYRKTIAQTFDRQKQKDAYYLEAVPFILYFKESYAFHGTYWHDKFGIIKTHGCINLSPEDARWLFKFLRPSLPDGYFSLDVKPQNAPYVRIRK